MQVKDKEKREAGDGLLVFIQFASLKVAPLLCYEKGTVLLEK